MEAIKFETVIKKDGTITFPGSFVNFKDHKVEVIILDKGADNGQDKLLSSFGAWQDSRPPEKIINDIRSARTFTKKEIVL